VLGAGGRGDGGTGEADAAGPRQLLEAVRAEELLEGVEPVGGSHHLEDHLLRAQVGDARAEGVGERHQLRALARRRRDADERELPLDGLAGLER
jgi:hypothetical protein